LAEEKKRMDIERKTQEVPSGDGFVDPYEEDEEDTESSDSSVPFNEDLSSERPEASDQPSQQSGETPPQAPQTAKSPSEPSTTDKIKNLFKNKAKNAAEKDLKKKAIKEILSVILKSPTTWWVIGIVLAILIGVAIFASMYMIATSPANGSTQPKPVNPVTDANWVKQAAILSGDAALKKEISTDSFADLKENLAEISKNITDTANKKRVDDLILKLTAYQTNPTVALKNEILAMLGDFFDTLENPMPVFTTTGRKPLDNITGYNSDPFNNTTVTKDFKATSGSSPYFQIKDGLGDAVNLYTDKVSPVYSPISGTVSSVSDDGLGHSKIVISNGDWEVLIAHITTTLTAGATITSNTSIGTTAEIGGSFVIQYEMCYCGKPVVSTKYDNYLWQQDMSVDYGSFLWKHMTRILKID